MEPSSQPAVQSAISRDAVAKVCREILAPLIEVDGGQMFLLEITADDIHIHLAGTCAGCPGSSFTADSILRPALQRVAPKVKVKLTTGWRVPPEAERMKAKR